MRLMMKRLGFSRFEGLLGLGILAMIVLVAVPPLKTGMKADKPVRTEMEAELLAKAVLDYHTDTGHWPVNSDGQTDLALLVPAQDKKRARALATSMNSATDGALMGTLAGEEEAGRQDFAESRSWLKEIPVDPWDHPFRVVVMGDRTTEKLINSGSGYPGEPPAGVAIVVLSAGPNGLYDTDLARLWSADLSRRLNPATDRNEPAAGNSFGGDDLGFVLTRTTLGEIR